MKRFIALVIVLVGFSGPAIAWEDDERIDRLFSVLSEEKSLFEQDWCVQNSTTRANVFFVRNEDQISQVKRIATYALKKIHEDNGVDRAYGVRLIRSIEDEVVLISAGLNSEFYPSHPSSFIHKHIIDAVKPKFRKEVKELVNNVWLSAYYIGTADLNAEPEGHGILILVRDLYDVERKNNAIVVMTSFNDC